MAAGSPPRPLLLLLLLALLCSHIALCSSAAPAAKPKPKLSAGRKDLVSSSDDDEGDEPVKAPKVTAASKIKKKVSPDAKNQTAKAAVKAKKPEPATTAKVTKKTTTKAGADVATAKPKVPKLDKAAAVAKLGKGATAKPDKAATAKPKSTADSTKSTKTGAAKAVKPVKSEGGASKPKKPSNSTADAGAKPAAKSTTKKAKVVADVKANTTTTVSKEAAAGVEEDVVLAEEAEGTEDLMSEIRGLPTRLHETLMPDLARLSYTSKAYLSAANTGIAGSVRPILGGRWASAAAPAASVALLLLPLFMLTALVRRLGPYLPLLHRALLLSQAYLAIYFATLALAAAATGLEPLRFFHAASPAAYAWTQAAQSLGFMGYLVLQMVDLVAIFSGAAAPEEDSGADATKALGLAQMVVGLAVGLHYYAAVFHRAAAGEAPRANWRVYAVYAACFVIVCACARAEKRKKAYLPGSDGADEEWKKS